MQSQGVAHAVRVSGGGAGGKKFVSVDTATKELGVTRRHIYNLLKAGLLEAIDISICGRKGPKSLRISLASIRSFMESRRVDPDSYFEANPGEEVVEE